jgi:hypothetical protein
MSRFVVCGCVTRRPIFAFVANTVRPNASLQVFAYDDDYSFGILQSEIHWLWFIARCSTLKADPRYTSNTVWDSFPWPQTPTEEAVKCVADNAVSFRTLRSKLALKYNRSLRELHRTLELPGKSELKDAQTKLNGAVRAAHGMNGQEETLLFLLKLNLALSEAESKGEFVRSAGLPEFISDRASFVTEDAITP